MEDRDVVGTEDNLLLLAENHVLKLEKELADILGIVIAILMVEARVLKYYIVPVTEQVPVQRNAIMTAEGLQFSYRELHITTLPAVYRIPAQVQQFGNFLRPGGRIGNP
ncbi:hypothetical protein GCM10011516_15000 [Sphingobacterium cellulitidis]|uniref:Uncharacterized protein n=1 Tax=Sphingobacterium cellulitidis TaxID=1768011 RepID=A0A8H9FZ86_9SPHI|nr:hypothetical protein GCM10011516_15000 [Sphingobacterium soli]